MQLHAPVDQGERFLLLDKETPKRQLVEQAFLVSRFKQARTECFVNLEGTIDNDVSDLVLCKCVHGLRSVTAKAPRGR